MRLVATAACLLSPLFAQARHEAPGVRVPFVGCASDGQVGPVPAPAGVDKVVQLDAKTASALAYYKIESPRGVLAPLGVLAPRGWSCIGHYGSGATTLIVTPQPVSTRELLSPNFLGISGLAIAVSEVYGNTAGRFAVARVIARIFPAQEAFVRQVIASDKMIHASDFPSGPYPNDKLISRSNRAVEYQTPPHSEGLGTVEWLGAGDYPIHGVAILQGATPDLLLLGVRVPPGAAGLASPVIRQFERDSTAGLFDMNPPGKAR